MSLPLLQERAASTDSCLEWHDVCGAECCKMFALEMPGLNPRNFFKGKNLEVLMPGLTDDLKWYYELHGATVKGKMVRLQLDNFKVSGDLLWIIRRCDFLTDDLKCRGHPDKKPLVCQNLNMEKVRDGSIKHSVVTRNCLFKFK